MFACMDKCTMVMTNDTGFDGGYDVVRIASCHGHVYAWTSFCVWRGGYEVGYGWIGTYNVCRQFR